MARFIKHESCPRCGSKDNLGTYDDGSVFCFGCRYYRPPTLDAQIKRLVNPLDKSTSKSIQLPEDTEFGVFPQQALDWLGKYSLTLKELEDNNFAYSANKNLLIFPVYEVPETRTNLLMWQGRYFGPNKQHPKYLTYGAKDVVHIIDNNSTDIGCSMAHVVLVEDLISAIKVGRVMPSVPLWGSGVPLGLATRLTKLFSSATLWLDMDKRIEGLKQAVSLSPFFKHGCTAIVNTTKDPKEYTNQEIQEILK